MPVPTVCYNIVRGKVMRVTSLDECGAIYVGSPPACEVVVTDGLISAGLTSEIETGEEIRDRNWAGVMCVTDKQPDELIRVTAEITFCQVDPSLVSLMTGSAVELDDDNNVVGFRAETGPITAKLAMELWSGTSPVNCGPGAEQSYGYTLLPFLTGGNVGDITIENGRADFVVTGLFTQNGGSWGVGPYDVVTVGGNPSPLEVAMSTTQPYLMRLTDVAPPEAACECLSLEEAGGTRPTS